MAHLVPRSSHRLLLAGVAAVLASLAFAASALADSSVGAFVIGDQNAAVGTPVTFWGAQWWMDNQLGGGTAPPSFKGWENSVPPACGQNWTTDPGNSSDPPAALPPFITVIVSDTITKSGPVISGDAPAVVTVAVDPGSNYEPDPGHPGTGVVTAVVCPPSNSGGGGGGPT